MGSTPLVGNSPACNPMLQFGAQLPGDFTTVYQRCNQDQDQNGDDCNGNQGPKGQDGAKLVVEGNTVTDGKYFIAATNDNSGTLVVKNTETGATFMAYGDPHIKTETGGTADFQHAPVTFKLPDGTEITVTPTDNTNANSVNTIKNVTITKGDDAVTMTGFTPGSTGFDNGNIDTDMHAGQAAQYEPKDEGTILTAKNGDLNDLVTADGTEIHNTDVGNIDNYANGDAQLSVNGNTVTDGRYVITGTGANSGTLTVKDTTNGESFTVWGDPHITTSTGGTADFQYAPATFKLPDGTEITVTPTNNPGVNTINNVTITKGNDAVTMTGFTTGHIDTDMHQGQAACYEQNTNDGTVLHAKGGNIDDLVTGDGTEIYNKAIGNIDSCANGDSQLGVNGNTVTDGRYVITGTDTNSGTLTVKDTTNGETFTVWGDPHINTSTGGTADFQHEPVTFKLPDGTEITVEPTSNSGVNTIKEVVITKGREMVTMTGFTTGHVTTTQPHQEPVGVTGINPGIVITAKNGNIDDLVLPGGTEIYKKPVGNIDHFPQGNSSSGVSGTTSPAGASDPNWTSMMNQVDALEQQADHLENMLAMSNGCSPSHHPHHHRPHRADPF
jgi:hypothetical protein